MWRSEKKKNTLYRSARNVSVNYYLRRKRLKLKNVEGLQWSLVAKRDLESGTFLGMYDGTFRSSRGEKSLYAAHIIGDVSVFPFDDESRITYAEREVHPFASMNEPLEGEKANCVVYAVDFPKDKFGSTWPPNFYRGLVCMTCRSVKMHEELTWYYGKEYDVHRQQEGYQVGKTCRLQITDEDIGKFQPVPRSAVYAVFSQSHSSSDEEYVPQDETRGERLRRRIANRRIANTSRG